MRALLALVLLVPLAACDSSGDAAGLVGSWRLYSIAGGFAGMPPTPVSGRDTQLQFDGDGRFVRVDMGRTVTGRYALDGETVALTYDGTGGPAETAFRSHPDTLVVEERADDGLTYVYGRLSD
ncbi:MAG TPA: hypothetical protein VF576_04315 [Rubricoccaceae bacterium]|jgi:hypothetical protein